MAAINPAITAGTKDRELLIAYLNVADGEGTASWKPLGKRVEDSSMEFDWETETKRDILGSVYNTMKKPTITQTFDPCELDGDDEAQKLIWKYAVVERNITKLTNMDMLIYHSYGGFAEHYDACMVYPSSLGGEGGGFIQMPLEITYGGTREVGTVAVGESGEVTFTAGELS